MKSLVYLNKLHLAGPQNLLCCVVLCYVFVYVQNVTHLLYLVLPKSSRNRNAARKLLVVGLCAARYRELYPL